ncbi:hypothetical protein CDD82_7033 [Ophiocordyceps australis]|uniref:Swiss Army Knife protein DSP-PTPase phosphatase domain-containing protein n=1 Tax=Ophiocordyceps australis TaxID=1399860 RepID=A0A2C5YST9_9HYPO|nr:hypothetical protein CDD82_7033 [Ophiocordyceps australis]
MRLAILGPVLQAALVAGTLVVNQTTVTSLSLRKRFDPITAEELEKAAQDFLDKPEKHPCTIPADSIERLLGHGFARFEWVTGYHLKVTDKLARSSAPHYHCKDSNQALTSKSVQYLKAQGVKNVISLNEYADSPAMKRILKANKINYTPIPTKDFTVPSLAELYKGYRSFDKTTGGATLVWCGYGHGRTGLMITAINVFREAEKLNPMPITATDLRVAHIETRPQVRLLYRLQDILDVQGFKDTYDEAMDAWNEAREAFIHIDLAYGQSEKMTRRAKKATQAKLSDALKGLKETKFAVNSHWQICRSLFDRMLQGVARLTKLAMVTDPNTLDLLENIMNTVKWKLSRPAALGALTIQSRIVENVLRSVVRAIESSHVTASAHIDTFDALQHHVNRIEDYRAITRSMFRKLQETITNLESEAEHMLGQIPDPEAVGRLDSIVRVTKGHVTELRNEALVSRDVTVISQCIDQAVSGLADAKAALNALAHNIEYGKDLTVEAFQTVRRKFNDMRIYLAEMVARESSQFIRTHVVKQWEEGGEIAYPRRDAEEQAKDLMDLATRSYERAAYVGEWLQEKANNLNLIKNILEHDKLSEWEFNTDSIVESITLAWAKGKEELKAALKDERETIESEISLTEAPIHSYLTASLLVQREAAMAASVLEEEVSRAEADEEVQDWRKKSVEELVETLYDDIEEEEEKRVKEIEDRKEKEAAEMEKSDFYWRLGLGVDIAFAVAAAIPSPGAPLAAALIWARQGLRIGRFLHKAIRLGEVPSALFAEVRKAASEIDTVLTNWKTKVPEAFRDWVSQKSPQQVFDGLDKMHEKFEVENRNVNGQAVSRPGLEDKDALSLPVQKPPVPKSPPAKRILQKSIGELMEDLENISVPDDEPGDAELTMPVSKLLRKLDRIKVPASDPGDPSSLIGAASAMLPDRVRRSVDAIRQELQEGALIPHHSSDVAFAQLLDDAAYYLPSDCDLKSHTMGTCIIDAITGVAEAG